MSQLPVPYVTPEIEYAVGVSSTGPFTFPFSYYDQDDIKVSVTDANGVTTDLTITTEYTVSGTAVDDGYSNGSVTLVSGVANSTVKIYRQSVIDRLTNYPETGPFDIGLLNKDLNKVTHILQELKELKDTFLYIPESSPASAAFDGSGREFGSAGEGSAADSLATNRQVDANGPNFLGDSEGESAVGTQDQWNTVFTQSGIVIQGNDDDKLFDLMTQFFSFIQNQNGAEASFYMRYQYQVDSYATITKVFNNAYPVKIPATSALPVHFMDIAQDIDYLNGDGTLTIWVDIYPIGAASANLYLDSSNLSVNTSEPR